MKVLFLTERFPWPLEDGGNLRTYHVLKALCQQHDVTLLSHAPRDNQESAVSELQKYCRVHTVSKPGKVSVVARVLLRPTTWKQSLFVLKNWSEPLFQESQKLLRDHDFDVVHFNHLDTAAFLKRGVFPTSVFDSHNCISKMAEQLGTQRSGSWPRFLYKRESQALACVENDVCLRVNVALACSCQDQQAFLKLAPLANVQVVPNGVETAQRARSESDENSTRSQIPKIVFTGAMDYAPNVTGMEWFCKKVLPIIQQHQNKVRVQIVGRDPDERIKRLHSLHRPHDGKRKSSNDGRIGVEVTGRVESVSPYLTNAAIVVVPLLDGGGTRLKILEAFAARKAVVSTTKGAEGISARPDSEILIADDPNSFAMAVLRLLRDPTEASRVGNAGYRLACQRYDWQTISGQIQEIYQNLSSATQIVSFPKSSIAAANKYCPDKVTL